MLFLLYVVRGTLLALFALDTVANIFFGFLDRTRTKTGAATLLTHRNHCHCHLVGLTLRRPLTIDPLVVPSLQMDQSGMLFSNDALFLRADIVHRCIVCGVVC